MKVRVALLGTVGKSILIDTEATKGATIGTNLFAPDGTVPTLEGLRALLGSDTTPTVANTLWRLIREIPANVLEVEALATDGLVIREADGDWVTANLSDTARIDLALAGGLISADLVPASVANAYLAQMAAGTVKGRALGAGSGTPTDLTGSQLIDIIDATPPVWEVPHVFQRAAIGAALAGTVQLSNPTAAANGAQQYTPALLLSGNAWRAGAGVSQQHDWAMYATTAQGGAQTTSVLRLAQRTDANAYTDRFTVSNAGVVTLTSIASGAWQATPIAVLYGGTGLTAVGSGQILTSSSGAIDLLAGPAAGNYFLHHPGDIGGLPDWQELEIADVSGLQAALDSKLASASYTAADVLAKLLTVDGAGSGLDADLLDGNSSAAFVLASAYTAADVLAKLLTVDGAGSGIDADLLDGINSAAFALLAGATFTGQIITPNGAVATPAVQIGSAATGIYRTGGGSLGIAIAGVLTAAYNANGQNTLLDGTAALPPVAFISDPDTGGPYRIGANNIGFSTGGTLRMSISNTAVRVEGLPLLIPDGIAAPGAAVAGFAQIYVDTADGDLKVMFGDGTVKTISVDT